MIIGSILLEESPSFPKAKGSAYSPPNEFFFLPLSAAHSLVLGIHAEGLGNFLAAVRKSFFFLLGRKLHQGCIGTLRLH